MADNENPFEPRSNFMCLWEKDEVGGWRYVGLTRDETAVLMKDEGIAFDGDRLTYSEGIRHDDREMILDLMDRRERARLRVAFAVYEARVASDCGQLN